MTGIMPRHSLRITKIPTNPLGLISHIRKIGIDIFIQQSHQVEGLFRQKKITEEERITRLASIWKRATKASGSNG
jgi:hypothetical protein